MQKIYCTQDRVILYLLKSKLTEMGIDCIIKNEEIAGQAAGDLPPVIAWPELWIIDDRHYSDAMKIIQDELSNLEQSKKSWKCSECGETLEGQFDVCWKCGQSKS